MSRSDTPYTLDEQVGYLLRRANQRHLAIFAEAIPELTTTQFAAVARLYQMGPMSQNQLGRETAMDAATIKGVVDRLKKQDLVGIEPDPDDRRRVTVTLTAKGSALFEKVRPRAVEVTARTLDPLTPREKDRIMALLARMI